MAWELFQQGADGGLAGPRSIITGSTPTSSESTTRASGVRPSRAARSLRHQQDGTGAAGDLSTTR
jgi:hypothetical protein